jgi:hypothetical protein
MRKTGGNEKIGELKDWIIQRKLLKLGCVSV